MEKIEQRIIDFLESKLAGIMIALSVLLVTVLFFESSQSILFNEDHYIFKIFNTKSVFDFFNNNLFPVKDLVVFIASNLWGDYLDGYSIMNIFFHLLNTIGICFILNRYNFRLKYLLSFIFFISPISIFSIYTVEGIDIILASTFGIASYLFYAKQLFDSKLFNKYLIPSLGLYYLSINTHYSLILLPFVFFGLNKMTENINLKEQSIKLFPYVLFMLFKLFTLFKSSMMIDAAQLNSEPVGQIILSGARLNHLFESLFTLNSLLPLYSFASANIFSFIVGIVLISLILGSVLLANKKISALAIIFFSLYIPISGILKLEFDPISPFVDRYNYLLIFILFLLLCEMLTHAYKPTKRFIPFIIVFFLILNISATNRYRGTFQDAVTMYTFVLDKDPYNSYALYKIMFLELKYNNFQVVQDTYEQNKEYVFYYSDFWKKKVDDLYNLAKRKGESPRP